MFKFFSVSSVKDFLDLINLILSDEVEISYFRKIFSDKAVQVFIGSPVPAVVRINELI